MNGVVISCYALGAWAALTSGIFVGGGDYSRASYAAALVVLWILVAQKLKKNEASLKSIVKLFLALAAVYFMNVVDFALDGQYLFAATNGGAFIASLGVALWVNKR
jgi:hypothetical protein